MVQEWNFCYMLYLFVYQQPAENKIVLSRILITQFFFFPLVCALGNVTDKSFFQVTYFTNVGECTRVSLQSSRDIERTCLSR